MGEEKEDLFWGGGGWKRCSECGEKMKEASIKVIQGLANVKFSSNFRRRS